MKRIIQSLFMGIGMFTIIFLAGCSGDDSGKVEINLGHHHPSGSEIDEVAQNFSDLIEEESDKEFEINVYSGGQLGEEGELIDGVNDGTVDASIVSPGLMDDYSDLFGIETMPYVFDDWDHADKVLNWEVGEIMKDDLLENSNIRLLGYLHFGFRNLLTTEGNEVKSVEDMEGLDVRSPESWVWTQMFKEW